MSRRSGERGAVSIEFLASSIILIAAVLIGLQVLLAMFSITQANAASRNAARSEVLQPSSGQAAGASALADPLRDGAVVHCSRTPSGLTSQDVTCTVSVPVPVLGIEWLAERTPELRVSRTTTLPDTGRR